MWPSSSTRIYASLSICSLNARRKNLRSLTSHREGSLTGKDWCPLWHWVLLWVYLALVIKISATDSPTVVARV